MLDIVEECEALEGRIKALKLPFAFALDRAGVPAATWSRWKAKTQKPTKEKWDAVVEQVDDIERRLK